MINVIDVERCVDRLFFFLCETGFIDDEGDDFYKFDDEYRAKYTRRFFADKIRQKDEQEGTDQENN